MRLLLVLALGVASGQTTQPTSLVSDSNLEEIEVVPPINYPAEVMHSLYSGLSAMGCGPVEVRDKAMQCLPATGMSRAPLHPTAPHVPLAKQTCKHA